MSLDKYYPPTEPVELLPSFVLYADILGFKSIIKENSKSEDLQNLNDISSTLHRILSFEKEAFMGISDVFEGKIKLFSDNYMLWIPIRDVTDGRPEIFSIVEEFARFTISGIVTQVKRLRFLENLSEIIKEVYKIIYAVLSQNASRNLM